MTYQQIMVHQGNSVGIFYDITCSRLVLYNLVHFLDLETPFYRLSGKDIDPSEVEVILRSATAAARDRLVFQYDFVLRNR